MTESIDELQALQQQNAALQEQITHLQTELEQAKQVILQLSSSNIAAKEEKRLTRGQIPYHSIQKSSPSTDFSDKDIGWVD